MKEGDVVLAQLPQADGRLKIRPAVFLRKMPPFGDVLVCGISTQVHQAVRGFDEVVTAADDDFSGSGLKGTSIIRLGFLALVPAENIAGKVGTIAVERHCRLLSRLCEHLRPKEKT